MDQIFRYREVYLSAQWHSFGCCAQMHPDQPPIHWGGAIMWRGTVKANPLRTVFFIGLGTDKHRMVIYPISAPDENGISLVNWIAEVTVDSEGWHQDGWFREVQRKNLHIILTILFTIGLMYLKCFERLIVLTKIQ